MTPPPASVPIQCNATSAAPAPTGGTIRDGHYVMTSSTYYANGGGCQAQEADGVEWYVCGTSWQIAQNVTVSGQQPQFLIANATVIPAGPTLSITITCGLQSQPLTFGYDATATELRLHTTGTSSTGRIDTFMLQ
jgi:hypothetical protein